MLKRNNRFAFNKCRLLHVNMQMSLTRKFVVYKVSTKTNVAERSETSIWSLFCKKIFLD